LGYLLVGSFASIGTIELPYISLVMVIGLENVTAVEDPVASGLVGDSRPLWKLLEGLRPAMT
jgi:hypothetical protein